MQGRKFFIIDDDMDDSELFIEALSSLGPGNQYDHASDGREAIEKLAGRKDEVPDAIFLDINMPIMNGWECLTKLKLEKAYKDIPVIIYTTSSSSKDKMQARNLGANCFITKMTDFRQLKKMLEIFVEKINSLPIEVICRLVHEKITLN